jgi:5-methyltetrahydropteroyltriglutamate--homocysteine methyltransferase
VGFSSQRFLTTHVGSLPRPSNLVRSIVAKEKGVPLDKEALASQIRIAVDDVVARQKDAGVDIVSDGEMSKPGYATYVKDRLTGFDGESNTFVYQDLEGFPGLKRKLVGDATRSQQLSPACTGPITLRDFDAAMADIGNIKAALQRHGPHQGFMGAASPGVISLFFQNHYYPDHESYVVAIGEAMRAEYEAIAAAGMVLQIDCPDLAMGRHIQFANLSLKEFRAKAAFHVEVLNHAVARIPPEKMRMHLCWGNYEGPHHCDVPLANIIDIVFAARPAGLLMEAANPRHAHEWQLFETVRLPEGKYLVPGVIESKSNFVEHPELVAQRLTNYARLVGRERVIAGSDCGFGTAVGQATVDPDVVWAKMKAMADGARIASERFW